MLHHFPRKNYDPKGYIHTCRKSQCLGDYLHVAIKTQDLFKNLEEDEAHKLIYEYNMKLIEKRKELA